MNAHNILSLSPVIPVIAVENLNQVVHLADALVSGGIKVLEITLRTPVALEAIKLIRDNVPEAVVGAGTVISGEQLYAVEKAGAAFAISPGLNIHLADAAQHSNIPLIPGVATAGELMLALQYGWHTLKLFPAEAIGGQTLLKSFYGPFPQVSFCPTGGISLHTALDYLKLPNVLCVGGSWLTPKDAIANNDWTRISQLAQEAAALANAISA